MINFTPTFTNLNSTKNVLANGSVEYISPDGNITVHTYKIEGKICTARYSVIKPMWPLRKLNQLKLLYWRLKEGN